MKDRLAEGVEFVQGECAEAAERVCLIQYPRNPPLLIQRREGDFELLDCTLADVWLRPTNALAHQFSRAGLEKVEHVTAICLFWIRNDMANRLVGCRFDAQQTNTAHGRPVHRYKQRSSRNHFQRC